MEYGLLGEVLGHSYSPMIHSYFAKYNYCLMEKKADELDEFFRVRDFRGINVTIPYKTAVIPYMDELTDIARRIGSVNTVIKRADGTLLGDNTDYGGFLYTLRRSGIKVLGRKCLVLGSGGASLTVQTALCDLGASSVTVISRSGENNYGNLKQKHSDAEIIVNTTPVGMYPNNGSSPVDLSIFPHLKGVVDIIANPAKTALMLQAERAGVPCAGGLPMLVAQAAYAAEHFASKRISDSEIERTYKAVSKKTKNIVLIGMPGCGKTTIGRRLAKILGREFVDTDAMIVERIGMPIPDFFASEGEEAFRKIETECASEACKKSGVVISTGGGIITQERNRDLLRQNGILIFINRPTSQLATRGRPLSESNALSDLAERRLPIYKKWASVTVENIGVSQTAGLIISFLHLKK
ncbi:MAG: AAA family ATPase [Clostridia bacterium]|nr:AAA family ATPase [Clostridia bacterium]